MEQVSNRPSNTDISCCRSLAISAASDLRRIGFWRRRILVVTFESSPIPLLERNQITSGTSPRPWNTPPTDPTRPVLSRQEPGLKHFGATSSPKINKVHAKRVNRGALGQFPTWYRKPKAADDTLPCKRSLCGKAFPQRPVGMTWRLAQRWGYTDTPETCFRGAVECSGRTLQQL